MEHQKKRYIASKSITIIIHIIRISYILGTNNKTQFLIPDFSWSLSPCPELYIFDTQIPTSSTVKYLGLTLDRRLTWAPHLKTKRQNLNQRLRLLNTFCNNNKYTHIKTKLLIYKSLIKLIWTYGVQLWGNAKKSNIIKIQSFQNIALRKLLNIPFYISNHSIQQDLRLNSVKDEAKLYYKRFHSKLPNHPNPLIKNLAIPSIPGNPVGRLKRNWCRDLLDAWIIDHRLNPPSKL